MALLEIRRPTPQAGGFYQYSMTEEQVVMPLYSLLDDQRVDYLQAFIFTPDYLQAPPQQEIDRQQAVVESTSDCIIPRLPQVLKTFFLLNHLNFTACCLVNQPTHPCGCDDYMWSSGPPSWQDQACPCQVIAHDNAWSMILTRYFTD